jgi:anti-sigma B factor antagonist
VVELVEEGTRHIVMDLIKTEHIGGAGLRVLLMLTKKLDSMDGGLVLCSMSQEVRKAFDLAGFTRLFSIAPSREEAIQELSGDQTVARVSDLAADLLAASEKRDLTDTD